MKKEIIMNKTINQLEKERKEKIKDLNLDEVKSYITNLNKKVYESFDNNNHEDVELYENKLKEVFDLTSDKYVNLDAYSLLRKFEITSSKMIENNSKKNIVYISHTSLVLFNSYMTLQELFHHLKYILMIYYHNYYTNENMLVEDLLGNLHCKYNFNDESFDEYAHSKVTKYNSILMKELNSLISMIKSQVYTVIEVGDTFLNNDFEKVIESILKEVDYEKQYVTKKGESDEGIQILKEGEYLHLLDLMKESYIKYGESCRYYIDIKEKILDLINSHDGFSDLKESDYGIASKNCGVFSKEEYIAMRPSYDVSSCEFIKSK